METMSDIFEEFSAEPKESVLITNTDPAREPRPLFNGKSPQHILQSERPIHRAVIMLKAAGRRNIEIAEALGITPVTVGYIIKQPWAEAQILKEIEDSGRQPVIEMLQEAQTEAVETIKMVMRDPLANKDTRRKAANDILDRTLGKPNQPISVTDRIDPTNMTLEEIDKRLSELHAKQN